MSFYKVGISLLYLGFCFLKVSTKKFEYTGRPESNAMIRLRFKTIHPNGLLLYRRSPANNDYLLLELTHGTVRQVCFAFPSIPTQKLQVVLRDSWQRLVYFHRNLVDKNSLFSVINSYRNWYAIINFVLLPIKHALHCLHVVHLQAIPESSLSEFVGMEGILVMLFTPMSSNIAQNRIIYFYALFYILFSAERALPARHIDQGITKQFTSLISCFLTSQDLHRQNNLLSFHS